MSCTCHSGCACVRGCAACAVCRIVCPCLCCVCARSRGSNAGWVKPAPARSPSKPRVVRCCSWVRFWDSHGGQRRDSHGGQRRDSHLTPLQTPQPPWRDPSTCAKLHSHRDRACFRIARVCCFPASSVSVWGIWSNCCLCHTLLPPPHHTLHTATRACLAGRAEGCQMKLGLI